MKARLTLNKIDIIRDTRVLINSFSHQFFPGQIVALIGNNGCGKTTLLKTIAGLLRIDSDRILIDGVDLATTSPKIRAQTISFLLQQSIEQPYCTVKYRIAHGLMPTLGYDFFLDEESENLIKETALALTIDHLLNRRLAALSGGELRLVNLAKCLINPHPKVLLLDEPTVYLDFTQQANVLRAIITHAAKGKLIIFSSHDAEFIERAADSIIRIHDQRATVTNTGHAVSSFNFLDNIADIASSGLRPSYKTR